MVKPQRRPSTERKQIPKREDSKEEKPDYLPVAQLRSQSQQQGSVSSRRRPSAQASSVNETQSVQSRARSATVTSDSSATVVIRGSEALPSPTEDIVEEETPATPAKDLFTPSPHPRRQRTAPPTPALALTSPDPVSRHAYPPKKAESYSHSSRSKVSHRTQTRSPTDFDENALVSREQLSRAAGLDVIAQNGIRVPFGDLFRDRKVIIIFIRHFWYVYSSSDDVA